MPQNARKERATLSKDDLFSAGEVAHELGMAYSTVNWHLRRGTIRSVKTPGGHYRVRRSEIERIQAGDSLEPGERNYGPANPEDVKVLP